MVVADILFVPTRQAELLTCAATNEAVSTPVRQTVQVEIQWPLIVLIRTNLRN